jgi:hypothetical protein
MWREEKFIVSAILILRWYRFRGRSDLAYKSNSEFLPQRRNLERMHNLRAKFIFGTFRDTHPVSSMLSPDYFHFLNLRVQVVKTR